MLGWDREIFQGSGLADPRTSTSVAKRSKKQMNVDKFDTTSLDVEKLNYDIPSDTKIKSKEVALITETSLAEIPSVETTMTTISKAVESQEEVVKNDYQKLPEILSEPTAPKLPSETKTDYSFGLSDYFLDLWQEWSEVNAPERKYNEVVTKQKSADRAKVDQYFDQCKSWHSEAKKKLSTYHAQESEKDIKSLTNQNVDSYVKNYKEKTSLTGSEGKSICYRVLELDDEKNLNPNFNREKDLHNCNMNRISDKNEIEFKDFENNQLKDSVEFCNLELESFEQKASLCEEKISKFQEQSEVFAQQLERYIAEKKALQENFSSHLNDQNDLISKQKVSLIEQQDKIDELQKERFRRNHQFATLNAAYEKVLEKLDLAKEVIEACKRQKPWFESSLAKTLGVVIEALLEILIWPYATFNEDSLFYKLYQNNISRSEGLFKSRNKLNALQRLFLTICISFVWIPVVRYLFVSLNGAIAEKEKESSENIDQREPSIIKKPTALRDDFFVRGAAIDFVCFTEVKSAKVRDKLVEIKSLLENEDPKSEKKIIGRDLSSLGLFGLYLKLAALFMLTQPLPLGLQRGPHLYPVETETVTILDPRPETVRLTEGPLRFRNINLPISESEVSLTTTEKSNSDSETQIIPPRVKRLSRKKRKQVQNFSDFVRETSESFEDFEESELIQEQLPRQQGLKIRN